MEEIENMEKMTTISISKNTKKDLSKFGKFGQSYDDIIVLLIKKEVVKNE